MQERWTADLGEKVASVAPGLEGGLVVETIRTGGVRGWAEVDARGQVAAMPEKQLPGQMHTRGAVLPDGSEVLFNWDLREHGNQGFDQENVQLMRVGTDQQVMWSRPLQSRFGTSQADAAPWPPVATPDGRVLVGFENRVSCLAVDGEQIWNFQGEIYGNFAQQPSVGADGTAYVVENYLRGGMFGSTASRLHVVRPDGTEQRLDYDRVQCPVVPTSDGGAIVISSPSGGGTRIEMLSSDGRSEWQKFVDGSFTGASEGSDGSLLLLSASPATLGKFTPEDGVAWTHALPGRPVGLPVSLAGGDVLVATSDGKIVDVVDSFSNSSPVVSPPSTSPHPAGGLERQEEWIVVGGVRIPRRRDA